MKNSSQILAEFRYISGAQRLIEVEEGYFGGLTHLRTIYVSGASALKRLPPNLFNPPPPHLRSLRIINSGLEELPILNFTHQHLLNVMDFENNKLKKLYSHGIRVRVIHLVFNSNELEEVEKYAFENSEIDQLSLRNNPNLKILNEMSFAGVIGIQQLDISETSILNLPSHGLWSMVVLKAENVISMKTIPSIHDFKRLKKAQLTHHFHCCAFKFPERHDPERHKRFVEYWKHMKKLCSRIENDKNLRPKRSSERILSQSKDTSENKIDLKDPFLMSPDFLDFVKNVNWTTTSDDVIYEDYPNEIDTEDEYASFHMTPAPSELEKDVRIFCENYTEANWWQEVECTPESDALNPCEDVLGGRGARTLGWTASIAATLGNMAVTAVLVTRPLAPPRLLLLQLAIADLCTALYLLLIAAVDTYTIDNYFNYAYDWQYGFGCAIAGFLAIWGAQSSLLALAALTLERWLAITHALLPQRRLSPKSARLIVLSSAAYSLILAAAPFFGGSHYSSTSICLPMRRQNLGDTFYLGILLCSGLFCLLAVIGCYCHIYLTLARDTPRSSTFAGDASVANKMAILIATHMACCVPVAVVGLGALIGHPILGVHGAKLLLVLIYPLNALADPFLYAILTHQFRRDLYLLLDRYGMCTRRAQQYKIPGVVGRHKPSRNTNFQLIRRTDGSLTTAYEDLLV